MMTMRQKGPRFYYGETARAQAFVFGAPAPRTMWAWAIYWRLESGHGGAASGVELSQRRALQQIGKHNRVIENADHMRGL